MRINLALWDRIFRFIIGILMGTWAVAGGPFWAFMGFYLILTCAWGFDPIYSILKISSKQVDTPRSVPPE
jgi:hypothetical protein